MNKMSINAKITEIQRFCMHDGPGIRTTVFFKGCPLRCQWCHNPETQKKESELLFYKNKCIFCRSCESVCVHDGHSVKEDHIFDRHNCVACFDCAKNCPTGALEICGRDMSVDEILSIIKKDSAFYGKDGGMTLSGGEPFLQAHAALSLLMSCKEQGISTAAETCGYADADILLSSVPYVDLFLWDVKDTDEKRHQKYTGVSNRRIIENLNLIGKTNAKIRLRCILINGINTNREHYERIAEIAKSLSNFDGVEIIPYHAYGGTKSTFLGYNDSGRLEWIPDKAEIEFAKSILRENGINVK